MATIELGGLHLPDDALSWNFTRASGPGGQNVNKVSTAVECRLNLDRAGLDPAVRQRLESLAGNRLTAAGEILVAVDTHRTQARNRAAALERLGDLVAHALVKPKPRIPTRPSAAQRARRRDDKKRRGEAKRQRRPPDDY